MTEDVENHADRIESQMRLQEEFRRMPKNVTTSGINNMAHFEMLDVYIGTTTRQYLKAAHPQRTMDYDVKAAPNPLEPFLDNLQRRSR